MPGPSRLIDYLTQKNPKLELRGLSDLEESLLEEELAKQTSINHAKKSCRSYTTSEDYPTPAKKYLKQRFQNLHDFSYVHEASLEVCYEKSLEALLLKTTHSVVLEALEKTSRRLLLQTVLMVPGGRGCPVKVISSPNCGPDWACKSEVQGNNNILPGDTKLSRNWESKDIETITDGQGRFVNLDRIKESTALLAPLKQLLHYCIESYTRYGYIITDKELVVFRVGPECQDAVDAGIQKEMEDSAIMEYQAIPWTNHGQNNQLTISLALWVLHILAANDGLLQWKYGALEGETIKQPHEQTKLESLQIPARSTESSFHDTDSELTRSASAHDRATMSFEGGPNGGSQSFTSDMSGPHTRSTKRKERFKASEASNVGKRVKRGSTSRKI